MLLPEVRKRINKRNKQRARYMERSVARFLRGTRVPMSGSGTLKGDCFVPFDEYRTIYVECKLTEKKSLTLNQVWLEKIIRESKSMRCIFGILVLHFVGNSEYHVLIREEDISRIELMTGHVLADPVDTYETMCDKRTIGIVLGMFHKAPIYLQTLHGKWMLIGIKAFRDWLDRISEINEEEQGITEPNTEE